MANSKLFMIPFGASGDRATIPDTVAPSGAVSWPQGFGPDYERDPATDPMAKRVPRDETNEYLYQITNAIKFLQLFGAPEWYADDGAGSPVSYPTAARVRHLGKSWLSLTDGNVATPGTDPDKWIEDISVSTSSLTAAATAAGLAYSQSNPGYIKLPSWLGGFIIQWGSASVTPNEPSGSPPFGYVGSVPVTFPIPFPNALLGQMVSGQDSPQTELAVSYNDTSRTGLTIFVNNYQGGQNRNVSYWVLGY